MQCPGYNGAKPENIEYPPYVKQTTIKINDILHFKGDYPKTPTLEFYSKS